MSSPAHWSQPSLSSPVTDGSFTHAHTPASPARVEARKFSQRQKEQSPGIAKCICLPPADLSKSTSVTTGPAVSRAPSWAHPRVETALLWRDMPKIYGRELQHWPTDPDV